MNYNSTLGQPAIKNQILSESIFENEEDSEDNEEYSFFTII